MKVSGQAMYGWEWRGVGDPLLQDFYTSVCDQIKILNIA
jgi:hypothetical protein